MSVFVFFCFLFLFFLTVYTSGNVNVLSKPIHLTVFYHKIMYNEIDHIYLNQSSEIISN